MSKWTSGSKWTSRWTVQRDVHADFIIRQVDTPLDEKNLPRLPCPLEFPLRRVPLHLVGRVRKVTGDPAQW